jgi:hypothetical protein
MLQSKASLRAVTHEAEYDRMRIDPPFATEMDEADTNERWREKRMDFIEHMFGIAPDGGSGSLELWLFVVPVLGVVAALAVNRRVRGRPVHSSSHG